MTEHEREKLEALEKRMDEILELIRKPEMVKDKKEATNMVEPLKITREMIDKKQQKKDEIMECINKDITKAVKHGWNETSFNCWDDSLYDEIKREYIKAGYRIYPNIYARHGGRSDFIAW